MKEKHTPYLEDIPAEEALERWFSALDDAGGFSPASGETVSVGGALGRITAEAVWAFLSSPHYHASAMDGYAVRSADTTGATETNPLTLKLGPEGPAMPVDTGDPLPAWADAVVMVEATQQAGSDAIEVRAGIAPWSHVRSMGEDMVASELVVPKNRRLTPADLGAIAGSGHAFVRVRKKPSVGIIPTGTELIDPSGAADGTVRPGDIIEYNSIVLSGYVEEWGGTPRKYPPVRDDIDLLREAAARAAAENDCVVVIAGSSAGREDYTETVINGLGSVVVHGVAIKPGHPAILGTLSLPAGGSPEKDGPADRVVPVLGAPGYPVSCALTAELFLEPLLARRLGMPPRRKQTVEASFSRKIYSDPGLEEFLRVTTGRVGKKTVAAPLARGAGVITSLVRADGIVRIPRLSEGIQAGDTVLVEMHRDVTDIDRTILHIGSHDICLDLLADFLSDRSRRFASSNAGSLGGLIALKRGEAHLAGSHLLDPETGEYNTSSIAKYLPNTPLVCITFMFREQGLIVAPGNPKNISSFEQIGSGEFTFVNRQRGAGTRVLFDYRLALLSIDPSAVTGYEKEEYTHLAVAAAVRSGRADCGLGIAAAAHALGLDFVPLDRERYELIIPEAFYESELLRPLLQVLEDPAFRRAAEQLPGYDTSRTGELRRISTDAPPTP